MEDSELLPLLLESQESKEERTVVDVRTGGPRASATEDAFAADVKLAARVPRASATADAFAAGVALAARGVVFAKEVVFATRVLLSNRSMAEGNRRDFTSKNTSPFVERGC